MARTSSWNPLLGELGPPRPDSTLAVFCMVASIACRALPLLSAITGWSKRDTQRERKELQHHSHNTSTYAHSAVRGRFSKVINLW